MIKTVASQLGTRSKALRVLTTHFRTVMKDAQKSPNKKASSSRCAKPTAMAAKPAWFERF